jgi:PAS domain S-box-containing protein
MQHSKPSLAARETATAATGGEMEARIAAFGWAETPLGPPGRWPSCLRAALAICLGSPLPMAIWWGPELTLLYNDAWRPILGGSGHPRALGRPGRALGAQTWAAVGPVIEGVLTSGEAACLNDQPLPGGGEAYATWACSPIRDERGGVGGVLAVATETTARVLGARRSATLRALAACRAVVGEVGAACRQIAATLAENPYDIPLAMLYLLDQDGAHARLVDAVGVAPGAAISPETVALNGVAGAPLPLALAVRSGGPALVDDLDRRGLELPAGVWGLPPRAALVLPLRLPGVASPSFLLALGLSPRAAFDDAYRLFLEQIAQQAAAILADAGAGLGAPVAPARNGDASRASDDRLRLAVEAGDIGIWDIDLRHGARTHNDRFRAIYGFAPDEPIDYERQLARVHPDDRARVHALITAFRDEGALPRLEMEHRIVRSDGQVRWVSVRGEAICDDGRQPTRLIGTVIDITARKRAEEALAESEARLRLALDATGIGLWEWDIVNDRLWWSPEQERLYGLEPGTFGGRVADFLAFREPGAKLHQRLADLGRGETVRNDVRIIRRDGQIRWIHAISRPMLDAEGRLVRVTGANLDITEMKQAEADTRFLADIGEIIRLITDQNALLARVTQAVADFLQVRRCLFIEPDAGRDRAVVRAQHCRGVPPVPAEYPIVDDSADALAEIEVGRTIINCDTQADPRTAAIYATTYAPYGERAYVAVPLMHDGRHNGTLWVSDDAPRQWQPREVELLKMVAERAGLAIENARLFEAERAAKIAAETALRRVSSLQAVTAMLVGILEPEDVIRTVLAAAPPGVLRASFSMRTADESALACVAFAGEEVEIRRGWDHVPIDAPLPVAEVIRAEEAIFIESPQDLARAYPHLAVERGAAGAGAAALLPLRSEGRVVGVLALAFDTPRTFLADERQYLQALADQAAQALERARLYQAERRVRERTGRLQALTARLAAALTPDDVVQAVLDEGLPALAANAGTVVRCDGDELAILGVVGYPEELARPWRRFPLTAQTALAEAARTGQHVWLESPDDFLRRYGRLPDPAALAISQAWGALPLVASGRVIGALGLSYPWPRAFDADARRFAATLADLCAQALERARLYEAEQRARAEAEDAVRMRDIFLSVAAHELKTPLTALMGNAQLLLRRANSEGGYSERTHRAISVIAGQAARLNKMIATLLDISRIETGQLTIERAPVDLVALVRRVAAETQPTTDAHPISVAADGEPLLVEGDVLRLEQVLQNLLSNAIKYSPQGGPVQIRLWRGRGRVAVAVSDRGIGIPPAAMARLFQRFYRAVNADTQQIAGMGIGLFVVKEIVTLHGGTVEVESSEADGTTFTVWLPEASSALHLPGAE